MRDWADDAAVAILTDYKKRGGDSSFILSEGGIAEIIRVAVRERGAMEKASGTIVQVKHKYGTSDLMLGDSIDFGEEGLLMFFSGQEANVVRVLRSAGQKLVRDAVALAT